MKIKRMTATFGGLEQATLTPGEGLTVITAPNEGGKSTWAGFLKAMLYGIDTRERDKLGFLADKNRYQPWSGTPMAGELQVEWQDKDITIRRFPAKSNPFGGFEAVYTASGDPVPGLTAANVGEQFTGAGKEVYLRSAFVGQNGAMFSHSSELEARISTLATSGQEDASYSATERTLKDWRNRRKLNRANGSIPALEETLSTIDRSLQDVEQARRRRTEAQEQLERLTREQARLNDDLVLWDRIEKHELNQRYGQAREQMEQAEQTLSSLSAPDPEAADWTAQEMRDWAEDQEHSYREALQRRERALTQRAQVEQKAKAPALVLLILTALLATAGVLLGVLGGMGVTAIKPEFCFYLLIGACAALIARNRLRVNAMQQANSLEIPEEPVREDWAEQAQRHVDYLAQKERLEREVLYARQRVDDLAAQGGQPFDTLELLTPPGPSKAATAARLGAVSHELARWQAELARTEGALAQMGDPDDLEARRDQLKEELAKRLEEYEALTIAMEALSSANDTLRERFSPALNQEAGEIFSALTGGRYPKVSLARDFSAQATQEGSLLPRSALALSAGTADQLYLAVRLALCRLTLPDAPLLLDDALAAFDDQRMGLALDYLKQLGQERQILLFSCHEREREWAQSHGVLSFSL